MLTTTLITTGMAITNGTLIRTFTIKTLATMQTINGTKELDGAFKKVILLQSLIQTHILKVHTTITIVLDGKQVTRLTGIECKKVHGQMIKIHPKQTMLEVIPEKKRRRTLKMIRRMKKIQRKTEIKKKTETKKMTETKKKQKKTEIKKKMQVLLS